MFISNPAVKDARRTTREEFEENYFNKTRPVQYSGLNEGMPAYAKWDFNFFKEKGKDIFCHVSDDLNDPAKITRKIAISDYISLLEGGGKCPYMTGWTYQKFLPELDSDLIFPEWHPEDFINQLPTRMQFRRRWFFFGKKGINCDLHIDCFSTSSWILMVKGQKTFRAISPLARNHISMSESLFDGKVIERLNSADVEILEFVLTPGTIMYVPTGWVHEIRNDTDNIMVTGGFTSKQHAIRFYKNYHSFISIDANESDKAYNAYLKKLKDSGVEISSEVKDSIEEEVEYTNDRITLLMEKQKIYQEILGKFNE